MLMMLNSVFEVSVPDVVAEDFGSEVVVLNLSNGKYYSLVDVAADLWRDVVRGYSPQDILDKLHAVQNSSVDEVRSFFLNLVQEKLIRPVEVSCPLHSIDNATAIIAFSKGVKLQKLEIFDDMADLILSDPIHDVDEDRGWPIKRTAVQ